MLGLLKLLVSAEEKVSEWNDMIFPAKFFHETGAG